MSHTVMFDEREKRIMNEINAFARRCRIGKVMRKPVSIKQFGLLHFYLVPGPMPAINETGYMPKCGCKLGSACCNAACPHATYATC